MPDERFPKPCRVRLRTDFDRVHQADVFAADDVLVLRGCRNGLDRTRLGLSVARQVGNAVVRNRWKRRIREAFRRCRDRLPIGYDFVARPRRGASADYHAIAASLPKLARQVAKKLARREA